MNRRSTLVALAAALALPLAARPLPPLEIPKKSPERLQEMATHVVVGTAKRVYATVEREGSFEFVRYVVELAVDEVEKGEGPEKDTPLYVRWFTKRWRGAGQPPADSSGHYGWTPKSGDRCRAFLARNAHDGYDPENADGGYNAIVPNGFERLGAR